MCWPHLALWTARNITVVYQAEQGQKPADIDAMFDHYDALNAEDYEAQKDRPLTVFWPICAARISNLCDA